MAVIVEGVDQRELDGCGDDGNGSSLDTQTDESENDTVGILKSGLGFPENSDESKGGEDVGDDGSDKPEARHEVSDVVEVADVGGLKGTKRGNNC